MTTTQLSQLSGLAFDELASRILAGGEATPEEAVAVLRASDVDLMYVVAAAGRLRRQHFGNTVKVNYLVNLKSGLCPENCNYCSQAIGSEAPILKYSYLSKDETLKQAGAGLRGGATRVCMVSSGRGPSNRDIDKVVEMTEALKETYDGVEVCACLGLLKDGQAEKLKAAGVDAYNHNINTAESHHDNIVQTHTYDDRVDTIGKAKSAGLSPCSGLIAGLGESDEQLVEALFALKELDADSIPVNFLMPFDGTPYENTWELSPTRCVKILAMARFVAPDKEIRIAGGREMHLRSMQATALHVANSIFLGDYLTSEGQSALDDLHMLRDNGFSILGLDEAGFAELIATHEASAADTAHRAHAVTTTPCGSSAGTGCGDGCGGCSIAASAPASAPTVVETNPTIRRRGAGTEVPANA
ncbi:MAG: biotin synthase BioB [Nocardioides sp.]|uniref:biotin synthase BioB n=1 Tax=Nocardioides sp. TaxID=35761 RepID=UPI0039E48812